MRLLRGWTSQRFFAKLRNVTKPPRTPEGGLIQAAHEASGLSARKVALQIASSDTQFRNWMRGYDARGLEVKFPALGLANAARILGVTSDELRGVGRDDAAEILDRQSRRRPGDDLSAVPTDELLAEIARRTGGRDDQGDAT